MTGFDSNVLGPDDALPDSLVAAARGAARVEVFTGAGMSADSGLDTFRDAKTGLWSKVDPQALASLDAWARDPDPMWAWYLWRATLAPGGPRRTPATRRSRGGAPAPSLTCT